MPSLGRNGEGLGMTAVRSRGPSLAAVVGVTAIAGYLLGLGWAMDNTSYDVWGALLLAPVLVLVSVPLASRAARRENDRQIVTLIIVALVLKLFGAYVRYLVAFDLYGGTADASMYHRWGVELSESIRQLDFAVDTGTTGGAGTKFIRLVTGYVYAVIGPTRLGGFFVYSWLSFWGLYFFYRAFRIGFPGGDHKRYAKLIFFLPSMLFWPSSIGKEAWMILTIGLTTLGAAKLLARQRGAFALLALGLWGTAQVRAHVSLLIFIAVALAYLVRRSGSRTPTGPVVKAVGVLALVVIGSLVAGRFEEQHNLDGVSVGSVDSLLERTESQTAQGGSRVEGGSRSRSPLDLPLATVTVLFRPFPYEAHNAQALVASAEGLLLLGLVVGSRRRLLAVPREVFKTPYVALAATYCAGFIFAFSSIGNFGIIARQRVQLFPFVLVLLALPAVSARRRRPPARRTAGSAGHRPAAELVEPVITPERAG
jgi:hypothetical protein